MLIPCARFEAENCLNLHGTTVLTKKRRDFKHFILFQMVKFSTNKYRQAGSKKNSSRSVRQFDRLICTYDTGSQNT